MNLSDLIGASLPGLREQAESLMLDYGQALRPTGKSSYNPTTKREEQPTTALFEAPYKIQTRALQAQESEVAGRTATTVRVELHLPAWTDPLPVGHLWQCITPSPDSLEVVGNRWRVTGPAAGSLKTARRYTVEATS